MVFMTSLSLFKYGVGSGVFDDDGGGGEEGAVDFDDDDGSHGLSLILSAPSSSATSTMVARSVQPFPTGPPDGFSKLFPK